MSHYQTHPAMMKLERAEEYLREGLGLVAVNTPVEAWPEAKAAGENAIASINTLRDILMRADK